MNKSTQIGMITFTVFMTEAMIHYNLGVNKGKEEKKFVIPPVADFVKLAAVVGIFSVINGVLINNLTK